MITILRERFRSFDGERSVVAAELAVDAKTDLPAAAGISGRILSQGTIAWEIGTGDFYGFRSDGKWVNQSTGAVYDPSPEEQNDAV